jgi:rod shape-determining protein MreB
MFGYIAGAFSSDMAIDLGTAISLVYVKERGIVLTEPSVVAVQNGNGAKRVIAFGEDAKRMLGRTPQQIEAIRPMQDGVIADFEATELMLQHFIRQVHRRRALIRPRIIVSVPSEATQVEKRAIREAAASTRAREVYLISEPVAAAIGAGLPITEPTGNMIVDIGGGTTQVAVISLSGVVFSKSVREGGDKMDQAIAQYIKRKYNLLVGSSTAENIKMKIGSAYPLEEEQTLEVKGRDLVNGIPKILTISSDEVRIGISHQLNTIVETVKVALEQMPPELAADLVDQGIVLTGGGALLKNIDVLLAEETQLPVVLSPNPLSSVVVGAGKVLNDLPLLKRVTAVF